LIIQGTNFILPFITYPYLVRVLDLEKYGLVMIAASLMVFFNILVDFGFNISATRQVSLIRNNKEELSKYFWSVYILKLFLLIIAFILLLSITYVFPKLRTNFLVYIFSFGFVIGQAVFPAWFFQGIERMRIITIVNVLAKVIFTVAIFIFIKSPKDYLYVPILNSLGFIFTGIIGFIISLRFINFTLPKNFSIFKILKENFYLVISNFATSIYTSGNTFILGIIGGETLAGIYSAMEKLVMATKTLYTPLYQAIFPWLASKKKSFIVNFIKKIRFPILISSLLIAIVILLFSDVILNLIYKNETIVNYSDVFRILGLIAVFASLNMIYVSLFFPAIKAYKKRMIPMVLGGVYNLIAAIIGAYFFGIYGVAIAAVSAELIILLFAHYSFKKEIK
jgi:PST family polysaccharide transporter